MEHIHLFVSRDKVFEKESVLQETIIIKAKRTAVKPQNVTITTTQSNADFSQKTVFHVPYDTVVSGEDKYVYLATNAEEVEVLKRLNRLPDTMPRIGLKMKTGLTVDFRNREALRDHADVVLYSEEKNWLYFIESVTSVGPMDAKRIKEIKEMTTGVTAGEIYVTAFLDFKTFKKFSETLAWETEVWIADMPDHMIHLNGDKFLGPR